MVSLVTGSANDDQIIGFTIMTIVIPMMDHQISLPSAPSAGRIFIKARQPWIDVSSSTVAGAFPSSFSRFAPKGLPSAIVGAVLLALCTKGRNEDCGATSLARNLDPISTPSGVITTYMRSSFHHL